MANNANNNEVVLSSLQIKSTVNVAYQHDHVRAAAKLLETIRRVATEHLLPPNDKTTLFLNALPSIEVIANDFLKPTEGFEEIIYEVSISQRGVLKTATVVVDQTEQ